MPFAQGHGSSGLSPFQQIQQRPRDGSVNHDQISRVTKRARTTSSLDSPSNNADVHLYDHVAKDAALNGKSTKQAVRRRISRACDQCNQLRTKCDGQQPCAHCKDSRLSCDYARARKKRGKASKKDLAAQKLQAATTGTRGSQRESPEDSYSDEEDIPEVLARKHQAHEERSRPYQSSSMSKGSTARKTNEDVSDASTASGLTRDARGSMDNVGSYPTGAHAGQELASLTGSSVHDEGTSILRRGYGASEYHQGLSPTNSIGQTMLPAVGTIMAQPMAHGSQSAAYGDVQFPLLSPEGQQAIAGQNFDFGQSPLAGGFFGQSPQNGTANWIPMTSPSGMLYPPLNNASPYDESGLKYPVLEPLLPYISSIMPVNIACELLEFYFSSTSSTFLHPRSPHVTGVFLRKKSFLRTTKPRQSTPALLASILSTLR